MSNNQETAANETPDSEQMLTQEEIKQFSEKIKSLSGKERHEAFAGQVGGSEVNEAYLDATEHYRLDELEIYVDTIRHDAKGGYPVDSVRLMTISPAEKTEDQEHLIRTKKEYEMDFIANQPFFFEDQEVYEVRTGRKVQWKEAQAKAENWLSEGFRLEANNWPEPETADWKGSDAQDRELNRRLGYSGFTHKRFEEAMRLLEQLGPHNRVESRH